MRAHALCYVIIERRRFVRDERNSLEYRPVRTPRRRAYVLRGDRAVYRYRANVPASFFVFLPHGNGRFHSAQPFHRVPPFRRFPDVTAIIVTHFGNRETAFAIFQIAPRPNVFISTRPRPSAARCSCSKNQRNVIVDVSLCSYDYTA